MNCTSSEMAIDDFECIIKKSPQIFNEIIKLATEHELVENEIFLLKREVLFALLVVIMTENGFQAKINEDTVSENMLINQERLLKWRQPSGLYETDFVMLGLIDISTKLIMVPLGPAVLVNIIINAADTETYSMCLLVDNFVSITNKKNLFHNLQQLSDTFKNKILTPVKSKLLSFCGYPGGSLLGLPEDLFLNIMFYLSISDVLRVSRTCRKFKEVLESNSFWHKMCIRDFNPPFHSDDSMNWRRIYQMHYKQCRAIT